jgi:cytidine deaminase
MSEVLSDEMRNRLIQVASQARKGAYAPYSNYAVGAALYTTDGQIFEGANVENAAYPSSMCAERVAVFNAVSKGVRSFTAIAVVTSNGGTPCGACRQVLSEFGLDIIVLIADESGRVLEETTVADLLPGAFGPSDLPTA